MKKNRKLFFSIESFALLALVSHLGIGAALADPPTTIRIERSLPLRVTETLEHLDGDTWVLNVRQKGVGYRGFFVCSSAKQCHKFKLQVMSYYSRLRRDEVADITIVEQDKPNLSFKKHKRSKEASLTMRLADIQVGSTLLLSSDDNGLWKLGWPNSIKIKSTETGEHFSDEVLDCGFTFEEQLAKDLKQRPRPHRFESEDGLKIVSVSKKHEAGFYSVSLAFDDSAIKELTCRVRVKQEEGSNKSLYDRGTIHDLKEVFGFTDSTYVALPPTPVASAAQ